VNVLVGSALACVVVAGCVGVPRAWERRFYDVQTNSLPTAVATNQSRTVRVVPGAVETYSLTPNATSEQAAKTVGGIAGLFGPWGELAGLAAGGLIGLYGMLRSSRSQKTAAVLAQVIETGRMLLEGTAQGRAAEEQWRQWMIRHQAETGVMQDVVKLLQSAVDEPSAKEVAQELLRRLQLPAPEVPQKT
jgi:hypothetical protein